MPPASPSLTALITGASAGIGAEFARLLAADGYDLVLVARSREKLAELAGELTEKHRIRVRMLAKDLSLPGAPLEIFHELQAEHVKISVLVNNAGVGVYGLFAETAPESELEMIQLN